jgi:predicted small integral membrane protein
MSMQVNVNMPLLKAILLLLIGLNVYETGRLASNPLLKLDIIYTDFTKAFDSIFISKLLSIVEMYGISGHLLNWIGAVLTNRTQRFARFNIFVHAHKYANEPA